MSARRPTGWLEDEPDADDFSAGALLRERDPKRQEAPTMGRYRSLRMFQGEHNACFAFALSRALHMFFLARGCHVQAPSPAFLYWIARAQENAGVAPLMDGPPLVDRGCYPRLGMKAVQALGFVQWSAWRYPEYVSVRPHAGVFVQAIEQADLSYWRVDDEGSRRVELMADALRSFYPVILGLRVGRTFEHWNGTGTLERRDFADRDAGHMVTLLDIDETHQRARIDNWWPGFGEGDGTAWVSFDVLGDPRIVGDPYVIVGAAEPVLVSNIRDRIDV